MPHAAPLGFRHRRWHLVLPVVVGALSFGGCSLFDSDDEDPVGGGGGAGPVGAFVLTVLHNNDGESKLIDAGDGLEDFGGVARFATLVQTEKTKAVTVPPGGLPRGVVMLSSGDNFLAGPELSASFDGVPGGVVLRERQRWLASTAPIMTFEDEPAGDPPFYDVIAMEAIGYDAICIGNHEFDFGPDLLARFVRSFTTPVPFLSANLDVSAEPELDALADEGRIAKRTVIEFGGEKVGVVGATTPRLPWISSPRNVVVDDDVRAAVQTEVDALVTAGINKIIVISHLQSIAEDLALVALLRHVDIVIAGGGSELLANPGALLIPGDSINPDLPYPLVRPDADDADVLIVTTTGDYRYLGRLQVTFDAAGKIITVTDGSNPIRVAGGDHADAVVADRELMTEVVEPVSEFVDSLASQVIGTSEVILDGKRDSVRGFETNQGNLIADALLWQAQQLAAGFGAPVPQVALQNGGGIRNNTEIPAGNISELTTFSMVPFANFVSVVGAVPVAQFKELLENAVSRQTATDGRFAQIAGFRMEVDVNQQAQVLDEDGNVITPGRRVREVVLLGDTETPLIFKGEILPGVETVDLATIDFLARGGDFYPFRDLPFTTLGVTYQQAVSNYIQSGLSGTITAAAYPEHGEDRLRLYGSLFMSLKGRYVNALERSTEVVAYDATTQRLFLTNGTPNIIEVIDFSNPATPTLVRTIDLNMYGAVVNSVAAHGGRIAVAVEADPKTNPGTVVFFSAGDDNVFLSQVPVGAQPDMLTFSPDGNMVLVANEGEPSGYGVGQVDPEGSVSIIDISAGAADPTVHTAGFAAFNDQIAALKAAGVHIFGPGATVAQDLEPEYITVAADSKKAWVSLQENNAIAVLDLDPASLTFRTITAVLPLGYKDHSLPGNGLDASDQDGGINIKTWPVWGMYMPDAIASFRFNGRTWLVTANEGDSRDDWDGITDERRINHASIDLDPDIFDVAMVKDNANLGRLRVTPNRGKNEDTGKYEQLFSFGGRSFSIWNAQNLEQAYDSGDFLERMTADRYPDHFNASHGYDAAATLDARSAAKGPEPEEIEVGTINGRHYAFIGLERLGGVVVFDVTHPRFPTFIQYLNYRDVFTAVGANQGDLGPEGMAFIAAGQSPNGKPLLAVANEVSGSLTIFEFTTGPQPVTAHPVKDPLILATVGETEIFNGGFGSGMVLHPTDPETFYLITDRGPNFDTAVASEKGFAVPEYTPSIGRFTIGEDGLLHRDAIITIKNETGVPITGLPNPAGMGSTGETAVDLEGNALTPDPNGLDSEGIVALADGTFWVSDEYGPHLVHIAANGNTIERVNPYGSGLGGRTLPLVLAKRRPNRGMEGLTITPDGQWLVGIMQSGLDNKLDAGTTMGVFRNKNRVTRLVFFHIADGTTKEYLYLQNEANGSNSGVVALSDTRFLILERDGLFQGHPTQPAKVKRIYLMDISGATDVTDPGNGANGLIIGGKTLEEIGTRTELIAAGIIPAKKTLIQDLLTLSIPYPHEKAEGMVLLPDGRLGIANDDDFGIQSVGGAMVPKPLPVTGRVDENVLYLMQLPMAVGD